MHALQCLGAAPLPMLDQIAEELAGPADAAFEKGETQFRETPGDAAEENRLGGRMADRGEMADVVICEIDRRQAGPWLLEALWKVGAMPSSKHFAQTGS